MYSEDEIERAVHFIAAKAPLVGQLRGQKGYIEHRMKVIEAQGYLDASGTVDERKSRAKLNPELEELAKELRDVEDEMATTYTQIRAADLKIEVWRSQGANNRRGNP